MSNYFSKLVSKSTDNPKVLFNTIHLPCHFLFSKEDSENVANFLCRKKCPSVILKGNYYSFFFKPVSLHELIKLVDSMKVSTCLLDMLPASLLKNVFQSVCNFCFWYICSMFSTFWDSLKTFVITAMQMTLNCISFLSLKMFLSY